MIMTLFIIGSNESCSINNGGCKHKCEQLKTGHVCRCKTGHKFARNGRDCIDINECANFGSCSQQCENTVGSFKCSCTEGYVQDRRLSHMCKAKGELTVCRSSSEKMDSSMVRLLRIDSMVSGSSLSLTKRSLRVRRVASSL